MLTAITGNGTSPDAGCALYGATFLPKSFAYSTKSKKICFTLFGANVEGFYACTIEEMNAITTSGGLAPYKKLFGTLGFVPNKAGGSYAAKEGHTSEFAAICQIAYDEVNDCAYFAYRNNHNDATCAPTGIYKYDFAADKIEQVSAITKEIYGVVVNNTPSKLF